MGKETLSEDSKCKRDDVTESEFSGLAAASRVHGSVEVFQAVLLLLLPSLEERQQARHGHARILTDRATEPLAWDPFSDF